MTMRKISELEAKPLSAESRQKLKEIVDEAYRKMGQRIAGSASVTQEPK